MSLQDKLLEKIKNIKPRSKSYFIIKNILYWLFFVVFVIVGAVSTSIIIFIAKHNDWDIHRYANDSMLSFFFLTIPYIWVFVLLVFVVLAYYNLKRTKRAYKYKLYSIVLSSIFLSIVLGFILYNIGFAKTIQTSLVKNISSYNKMFCERASLWHRPERGVIVGQIKEINNNEFILQDPYMENWTVIYDKNLVGMSDLMIDNKIKALGYQKEQRSFFAAEIRESSCGCGHINCKCGQSETKINNMRNNKCGANN